MQSKIMESKINAHFANILTQLSQLSISDLLTNSESGDATIADFKGYPYSELGIIPESDYMGIYLTFGTDNPQDTYRDAYLDTFLSSAAFTFLPELTRILSALYSESTNSDSCSYTYHIDSDHMNASELSIEVHIKDYLS